MTRAIAQTYELANDNRAKITIGIMAVCVLMAAFYMFNLYGVISKTIAVGKADSLLSSGSASVNALDSQYLSLVGSVTPDALASYGLETGHVAAYIDRSAPTASLGNLAKAGHEL
ncbi:MAG: hypothetical protein KGI49_01160 [Patescibacteria group bacterium]|nr:hypothetical protein [Patescibacteria group bacterium]